MDQFTRIRNGDRFWFQNGQFTDGEIDVIVATRLKDVVERNTGLTGLRDNLFKLP